MNDQLFCQFWCRNSKIMDRITLRAKFGCAQFQHLHLQAVMSQYQVLHSQQQCLEAEIWGFFDANPCLIKKIEHKTCWPFGRAQCRRSQQGGQSIWALQLVLLRKAALAIKDKLSGKVMCCSWLLTCATWTCTLARKGSLRGQQASGHCKIQLGETGKN